MPAWRTRLPTSSPASSECGTAGLTKAFLIAAIAGGRSRTSSPPPCRRGPSGLQRRDAGAAERAFEQIRSYRIVFTTSLTRSRTENRRWFCAIYARKYSGRCVGARIQLEVADQRDDLAARHRGTLAGAESGMTAHRLPAFAFVTLSRSPHGMGPKEYDRRSRRISHDR